MNILSKNCLFLSLICLLLFGCYDQALDFAEKTIVNVSKTDTLEIQISSEYTKAFNLSDFNCLIGEIEKISILKDYIIIYDGALRLFNYNDKSFIDLSKRGKGPSEYISVNAIRANDEGVYFIDRRARKLHKISFEGKTIFTIDVGSNPSDFSVVNDSLILFFHGSFPINGRFYKATLFNIKTGKHSDYQLPYPENHSNFLYFDDWNNISTYNKSIKLRYSASNLVYEFDYTNLKLKNVLEFDFGENNLDETLLNNSFSEVYEFVDEANKRNIFFRVISFYETEKYLISSTFLKNKWYIYIYNKKLKTTQIFDKIKIGNKSLEISFDVIPKGCINGNLFFILEPYYIKENELYLESILQNRLKSISVTANPLILVVNESAIKF